MHKDHRNQGKRAENREIGGNSEWGYLDHPFLNTKTTLKALKS
jgi:hypothetical protein